MLQDLRLAFRRVLQAPGFTTCAIVILGAGVGLVAAMASVVYGLAFRPLDIPQPDTLVAVFSTDSNAPARITPLGAVDRLRAASLPADGWCAHNTTLETLEADGRVSQDWGELMAGDCASVLRVEPVIGRWFTDEEAPLSGAGRPVVIISDALWKRLFDGAPGVLGRSIKVQNISATVIGVMPETYRGLSADNHSDYILPFNAHRPSSGGARYLGRLQPHRTIKELQVQVASLWPSLLDAVIPVSPTRAQTLAEYRGTAELMPYGFSVLRRLYMPIVTRLTWVALALFALVCVNVGGMMVSRAAARSTEFATMRALGGSPMRIARQLAVECALMATAATAIGATIAYMAGGAFTSLLPIGNQPWDLDTRPDAGVLTAVVAACIAAAVLLSALPAALAVRGAADIRSDRTVSKSTNRWAQSLLVIQVAVTVMLVFAGGLLAQSFSNLRSVDRGYVRERLLSLRLTANPGGYRDLDAATYYPQLVGRLAALPGVESAGLARYFGTLNGSPFNQPVGFAGSADDLTAGMTEFISPGFFAAVGIPLLSGRDVAWTDQPSTAPVAVVSESLARDLSPDADVIGRVIRHGSLPTTAKLQIVGVVGDVSFGNVRQKDVRAIYVSAIQLGQTAFATAHLRTRGSPMTVAPEATRVIASLGREHVFGAYAEDVLFINSMVAERMGATISAVAAAMALVISCVGLFALLSHSVHARTREIGIRLAVGATPRAVSTLIMRDALRLSAIGVAVGLPLAVAGSSIVRTLLFGVTPTDWATLVLAAATLFGAAMVGAAVPVRRAVRVDPTVALRTG